MRNMPKTVSTERPNEGTSGGLAVTRSIDLFEAAARGFIPAPRGRTIVIWFADRDRRREIPPG